ncbi:hypothetical protein [uncultured Ferrimonas sp.]|uniref:hypothetical protein n=1 Tax=uncultured Ferrimonas sp. TaxID=432640 RepID=UPI002635F5B6|nr:hypothetical protein [uncultured Ferrimonas sp.]
METATKTPDQAKMATQATANAATAVVATLAVSGQGALSVAAIQPSKAQQQLTFYCGSNDGDKGLKLTVSAQKTTLYARQVESDFGKHYRHWQPLVEISSGIDADPNCAYWISIDSLNQQFRYGKGEMRAETGLLSYGQGAAETYLAPRENDQPSWLHQITQVEISSSDPVAITRQWTDPVTIKPPLLVSPINQLRMVDVACASKTVAKNLSTACQQLYANISGRDFTLNTEDFPDFADAINASINNPNGWCYQQLARKHQLSDHQDKNENYLRITLGQNQGESPGIPYVMEIWPCQSYSPIHNHANADAIIRVLDGEINVSLFAMLSAHHQQPFASQSFRRDDITWISAGLNQTHQLRNLSQERACITIQCYQYQADNLRHYEYFDYLDDDGKIARFSPDSDMGFLAFKSKMWLEWQQR